MNNLNNNSANLQKDFIPQWDLTKIWQSFSCTVYQNSLTELKNLLRQIEHHLQFSLNDFKGQRVILYFYPKDNTSGCTQEACDFRDNNSTIEDMNAIVIGVSRDSLKSHDKFIEKFNFSRTSFHYVRNNKLNHRFSRFHISN